MLEGMFTEGLTYCRRGLESRSDLSRYAQAWLLYGVGLLAAPLGELDEARTAATASVELARAGGDVRAAADGLAALSVTEWSQGDLGAAAAHQDEAMLLYESLRDPWRRVDLLVLRACTTLDEEDRGAAALLEEAVPLGRSLNDHHAVGMALVQLSQCRFDAGDLTRAVAAAEEALEAHEAPNEPEATAGALHLLGRARLGLGQVDEARALHRCALDLASGIGHGGALCEAVEDVAAIAAAEGDVPRARALLEAAAAERASRGVPLRRVEAARLDALRRSVGGCETAPPPPTESWQDLIGELRRVEIRRSTIVRVVLQRQPGCRPLLLASAIEPDVGVSELDQPPGDGQRRLPIGAAVDDDRARPVWQGGGGDGVDCGAGDVQRSGKVPASIEVRSEGLDQRDVDRGRGQQRPEVLSCDLRNRRRRHGPPSPASPITARAPGRER